MYTDTQPTFRTVVTGFAAAAVSTGLLLAVTTSPVKAATNHDFKRSVESQLAREAWAPTTDKGVATVAVRIDAAGVVQSAQVVGSSGFKVLDRAALDTAKAVSYPKGNRARTVAVVLTYGEGTKKPGATETARLVKTYVNAKGEALAAQIPAPTVG
ncbi:MAG: energy transducer TonB [Sphingomonadales bacterium]